MTTDTLTVGLDATRGGWVAAVLRDGRFDSAHLLRSAREALERWPGAAAYGVDIPIGLLDVPRDADAAARTTLVGRSSTVFTSPCASAILELTHADANRVQRSLVGAGLSAQSFALKERILDAATIAHDPRVHEVHPELVFARLARRPLVSKRSWNGLSARRAALGSAGVVLPDQLPDAGLAPADDVLDAAAVALAAWDCVHDRSPRFPAAPTQTDAVGRVICIRG